MDNARNPSLSPGHKWGWVLSVPRHLINALQGVFVIGVVGAVALIGATVLLPESPPLSPEWPPLSAESPPLSAESPPLSSELLPPSSEPVTRSAELPSVLSPADADRYAQRPGSGSPANLDSVVNGG